MDLQEGYGTVGLSVTIKIYLGLLYIKGTEWILLNRSSLV